MDDGAGKNYTADLKENRQTVRQRRKLNNCKRKERSLRCKAMQKKFLDPNSQYADKTGKVIGITEDGETTEEPKQIKIASKSYLIQSQDLLHVFTFLKK